VQRASRLARERRAPAAPTSPIAFRIPGARWPRWVKRDEHGQPLIVNGELQLHGGWAPPANSDEYRIVLRDAYLLSRGHLAPHIDGRAEMAINTERLTAGRTGAAAAGPYPDGPDRRDRVDRDVLELARRSNISLADAHRISPDVRSDVLAQLRRRDAETIRHQAAALRRRLTDLSDPDASTT
ncbi:MAG: hypothetical protein M3N47_04395, partial [Chloroflexota bacterium]|nr:hypothetical protein [Chloroflexota bacterium]